MFSNGSAFRSYIGGTCDHVNLRNIMCSVDYYIGLVRYGDFNRISLEAKACGCKVISYWGNPYADYWIPEGDQRIIATKLIEIFRGNVQPRETAEVPDIKDTAREMIKIYEDLLNGRDTKVNHTEVHNTSDVSGGNGAANADRPEIFETVQNKEG